MANQPSTPQPLDDATRVLVNIEGVQIEDDLMISWSEDDQSSVEGVNSPNRFLGTRRSSGGTTITISQTKAKKPAVNYRRLKSDDTLINLELQTGRFVGNQFQLSESLTYVNARVSTVTTGVTEAGEATNEVTIVAGQPQVIQL